MKWKIPTEPVGQASHVCPRSALTDDQDMDIHVLHDSVLSTGCYKSLQLITLQGNLHKCTVYVLPEMKLSW